MRTILFREVLSTIAILMVVSSIVVVGASSTKVDLNKANVAELSTLPGVGTVLANRIVTFREENGPFQRIEDLLNVQGIGEKNFLRIKERITVGSREEDQAGGD